MLYFVFAVSLLFCFCLVQAMNNRQNKQTNSRNSIERNAKRTEFIYEQIEANLERWKQSDIIHITPNNIYVDLTFNQINYAMDFTWFFFGLFSSLSFCWLLHFVLERPSNGRIRRELIISFLLADIKQCNVIVKIHKWQALGSARICPKNKTLTTVLSLEHRL